MPGGAALGRVKAVVRNYVGDALDWDLNPVLAQAEVPPLRLGVGARLGWTTWLASGRLGRDGDDLKLDPSAQSSSLSPTRSPDQHDPERIMTEINRAALFGKLNPLAYKAIESATVFCKMRGNPYVELVHWLNQILQGQDSDLHRIIRRFQLDPAGLARDFTESLDRLPRGSRSISDLSSDVEEAVERAWTYRHPAVRRVPGAHRPSDGRHPEDPGAASGALLGISRQFDKVQTDALTDGFAEICSGLAGGAHVRERRLPERRHRRPPARRATPWPRPRWASSRRSSSSPWT